MCIRDRVYTLYSFQQFVEKNFSTYIASQVFKETSKPEKIYFSLKPCEEGYSLVAADSDSNKLMTGELFEIKNNMLRVVSLDGHRISIRKIALDADVTDKKLVVPGKTLIEISKILSGEAESKVNISYTNNHIVFEFDNTVVVSRLLEGEYFKIDQMLSMIQQADNLLAQLDPNIDFNSPTWQAIKQLLARLGITLPEVPSISELRQQLAAKQTELQTQRDSLTQQKADLQRTLNETIAPAQSTLDQQNAQLTAKEQELSLIHISEPTRPY